MWFLLLVEVLVSIMLVIVILLQRSKSGGMGTALGGGVGESLFGVQAGNVLTRITTILTVIFLFDATLLAWLSSGKRTSSLIDALPDGVPAAQQQAPMAQRPDAQGQAPGGVVPAPASSASAATPAPATVSLSDVPAKSDAGMTPAPAAVTPVETAPATPAAAAPATQK